MASAARRDIVGGVAPNIIGGGASELSSAAVQSSRQL